jgi:hypothetical protein
MSKYMYLYEWRGSPLPASREIREFQSKLNLPLSCLPAKFMLIKHRATYTFCQLLPLVTPGEPAQHILWKWAQQKVLYNRCLKKYRSLKVDVTHHGICQHWAHVYSINADGYRSEVSSTSDKARLFFLSYLRRHYTRSSEVDKCLSLWLYYPFLRVLIW